MKPTKIPKSMKRTALRKARARIARGSVPFGARPLQSVVTRVIPLADDIAQVVWDEAPTAARVLRGTGPGSLFELVIDLHASGFRLFGSGAERSAFLDAGAIAASGFDRLAESVFADRFKAMTAANLRAVLAAAPRRVARETDAAVLAERLAKATKGKPDDALVVSMADALTAAFPTWQALAVTDAAVGRVLDTVFAAEHIKLPSLAALWTRKERGDVAAIGTATLAWDAAAPVIAEAALSGRFAGVVARYLAPMDFDHEAKPADKVQQDVTTVNANGLSWLLGVGRRAFADNDEPALARALDIDGQRGMAAIRSLRDALHALPTLTAFGERIYSEARASLGGTINSLIATYVARLLDIRKLVTGIAASSMPVPASLDAATAAFEGQSFTADDVRAMYAELPARAAEVAAAIDVLTGRAAAVPGTFTDAIDTVDVFGRWAERFDALKRTLKNVTRENDATADWLTPLDGQHWKSLVRLSDPQGNAETIYPELESKLGAILSDGKEAFARLVDGCGLSMSACWPRLCADQSARVQMAIARGKLAEGAAAADVNALARRDVLDRIVRVARRCDPVALPVLEAELRRQSVIKAGAISERNFRAHVHAGQQFIYAHPLSGRRALVRLEHAGLARFDPDACLAALRADAMQRHAFRDTVLIDFAEQQLALDALPDDVPAELVSGWPATPEKGAPWVTLTPRAGYVKRMNVIKAFSARFHSTASGLLYQLNRVRFMERYDIRAFVGPTTFFVPKEGAWTPPPQYRTGALGAALTASGLPADAPYDAKVLAKALAKLANQNRELAPACATLLSQLPHEWAIACAFPGAPALEGILADAGTLSLMRGFTGYRLQPPRHVAGELLRAFRDTGMSPHGLTFERHFERADGGIRETSRRVVAAIPLTQTQPVDADHPWVPRHVMGLDLGEAGLGVTLRHLGTGAETTFFVKTRMTRRLSHQADHYRRKDQPRQVFRKSYSESIEYAVKSAIGEVCHHIDSLMAQYDAVPVFESGVQNARGSNKMVQRVFAGVIQRYVYVHGNLAAETVRKGHWQGASRWTFGYGHDVIPAMFGEPVAKVLKSNVDTVFRPATGTPGVTVSSFRSSLRCSCCGRDAGELLQAAIDAGQSVFTTDAAGCGVLHTPDGKHELLIETRTSNPATQRAARKRGRRAPWEAVPNQAWDLTRPTPRAALAKLIRFALRRPSDSVQGHATSQWMFHCPFTDCGAVLQADVNASTILARRYTTRIEDNAIARIEWADHAVRKAFTDRHWRARREARNPQP